MIKQNSEKYATFCGVGASTVYRLFGLYLYTVINSWEVSIVILLFTCCNVAFNYLLIYFFVLSFLGFIYTVFLSRNVVHLCCIFNIAIYAGGMASHKTRLNSAFILKYHVPSQEYGSFQTVRFHVCRLQQFSVSVVPSFPSHNWCASLGFYLLPGHVFAWSIYDYSTSVYYCHFIYVGDYNHRLSMYKYDRIY